jgi:hypothetical protein
VEPADERHRVGAACDHRHAAARADEASAVLDAANHRIIVFGGHDHTASFNDVWQLAEWATNLTQLQPIGTPPSARFGHTAIYDPGSQRMIVFGGDDGTASSDLWQLTLGAIPRWTQLLPSGTAPSARRNHSAIYDPNANRTIVFGGTSGAPLGDLWSLALTGAPEWVQMAPSGSAPSARFGHSAVFVPGQNAVYVFGGRAISDQNDLWKPRCRRPPPGASWFQTERFPLPATATDDVRPRPHSPSGGKNTPWAPLGDVRELTFTPVLAWTDRTRRTTVRCGNSGDLRPRHEPDRHVCRGERRLSRRRWKVLSGRARAMAVREIFAAVPGTLPTCPCLSGGDCCGWVW